MLLIECIDELSTQSLTQFPIGRICTGKSFATKRYSRNRHQILVFDKRQQRNPKSTIAISLIRFDNSLIVLLALRKLSDAIPFLGKTRVRLDISVCDRNDTMV